jgi:hypothetical protein
VSRLVIEIFTGGEEPRKVYPITYISKSEAILIAKNLASKLKNPVRVVDSNKYGKKVSTKIFYSP